jgi:hypothetical protein
MQRPSPELVLNFVRQRCWPVSPLEAAEYDSQHQEREALDVFFVQVVVDPDSRSPRGPPASAQRVLSRRPLILGDLRPDVAH